MKIHVLIIFILLFAGCKQSSRGDNTNTSKDVLVIDLKEVARLLDSISVEDQKHRYEIDPISEKFGWDSDEMKNLWKIMNKTDSSNLVIVEQILDTHGWLSSEEIGTDNSTLFFVIQHSNQETQEKYLPMMRKAVKEGKAYSSRLALLEDRIVIGKGELQVYGTQMGLNQESGETYVLPMIEPEKVNERRAEIGLGPIEDYVSHWDLEWNVEEYKRKLPQLIEKMNAKKK